MPAGRRKIVACRRGASPFVGARRGVGGRRGRVTVAVLLGHVFLLNHLLAVEACAHREEQLGELLLALGLRPHRDTGAAHQVAGVLQLDGEAHRHQLRGRLAEVLEHGLGHLLGDEGVLVGNLAGQGRNLYEDFSFYPYFLPFVFRVFLNDAFVCVIVFGIGVVAYASYP